MKKLLKLLTLALLCGAGAAITSLRAAAPKAEGVAAAAKPDECTVEGEALTTAIETFTKTQRFTKARDKASKAKKVAEAELKQCCDARKGAAVAGCEVLLQVPKKLAKAAKPAAAKNSCTAQRKKVEAEKDKLDSYHRQPEEMQRLLNQAHRNGNAKRELETIWQLATRTWKACCKLDSEYCSPGCDGTEGC
jgi:hypothetical protein